MNTQNKFRSAALILGVLSVLSVATHAMADDTQSLATPESSEKAGGQTIRPASETEQAWGCNFRPIDSWMRMHMMLPPMLGPVGEDLIVESIRPGSSAELWNFKVGDVILESDRGPIGRSEQIGTPEEIQFFRILRRGAPSIVHRKPWTGRNPLSRNPMDRNPMNRNPMDRNSMDRSPMMDPQVPMPHVPVPQATIPHVPVPQATMPHVPVPQAPMRGRNQVGTSASSYSGGGSAVAISQVGNQIQIEVSENGVRNQFKGTAASIREQMAGKNLSPETISKITHALRRMEP